MIYKEHLQRFTGEMLNILNAELDAGNSVAETWHGDFNLVKDITFIALKKPFITPIRRDLPGIRFNHLNDPHYWKAEYFDEQNKLLLVCRFTCPEDLKMIF